MAQETLSISSPVETEIPSTQGMTTKVFKGSFWTFIGQVLPLGVALFTTPFVIRLLGSEAYGVLVLVILIPSYFNFADFGMSLGSTKFGSEAYAKGSKKEEGEIVRTAALISFSASLPIAVLIFILSFSIVEWFKVPAHLQSEASLALKFASITFVLNFLSGIFNTPQLTRLRMDLNTLVNAGFRIIGLAATPIILYLGGGIAGALFALMIASFLTLIGHLFISGRLLKELFRFSINRNIIRPLLKFGGALAISGIAAILLANLEKVVLARVTSVEALAYYSVAFTLASMATMFSSAMVQSLLPAFSQLLRPEKKDELNKLFSRSLRINIIGLIPLIMFLFVIAKPFFTIWAGENFGRESSIPFYVLLFGLFFNIIAYIPHSVLMASGRTDIFAKLYWIELFPYILLIAVLTYKFGAVGAAAAWSLRVIVDAAVIIRLAKNIVGVSLRIFQGKGYVFASLLTLLIAPVLIMFFVGNYSLWLTFSVVVCITIYSVIVWKKLIESEERNWIINRLYTVFNR
ncbi:MAG: flippase [Acidobacteriota bacterium]